MSLRGLMNTIESHRFAAYVNVANDLKTFLLGVQAQNAVQTLQEALNEANRQFEVFVRVVQLCRQSVDPRYAHPWDTALAVYLWVLRTYNPDLAHVAAEYVVKVSQCWWARRIAIDILFEPEQRSTPGQSSDAVLPPIDRLAQQTGERTGERLAIVSFISDIDHLVGQFRPSAIHAFSSGSWYGGKVEHESRTEETDDPAIESVMA